MLNSDPLLPVVGSIIGIHQQPTVAQISMVMSRMHEKFKAELARNTELTETVNDLKLRLQQLEKLSLLRFVTKLASHKRTKVVVGGAAAIVLASVALTWIVRRLARAMNQRSFASLRRGKRRRAIMIN